jgi:hypothetical protein
VGHTAGVARDAATGAPLPHDPLPGSGIGFTPLASTRLALFAGAPFALLLVYWIALAVRAARLADPRRPQRQAYRRLASAIEAVRRAATAEQRIAALLVWQHTAALALGLDLAAPTAAQLPDQRWIDLWAASERGLYGREHALPDGWCDRALAVCRRSRRPRFNPLRAVSVRHLVPKAAPAALLLAIAVAPARAAESVPAEAQNDSAAAHEQLLAHVSAAPADWVARYNLGLSTARRGDTPRALAETIAAFVHNPRNASVRWNATAFAARVPGLDSATATLIAHPGLAGLASPAVWQGVVIAAAFAACSGAALMLRRRYDGAGSGGRLGLALLAAGVVVGAAALISLRSYGALADPGAAIVAGEPVLRAVPTDAEPAPQQQPLAAGTLVVVERDFLGWVKIGLRSGETGWLRHGDLVPLYAAPSA